jgi:hypothetical protein
MAANLAACGINPDRVFEENDPTWFAFTNAWLGVLIDRQEESMEA